MSRNEFIAAVIRLLGVYIFVETLIGLLNSVAFIISYTVGMVRALLNGGPNGLWFYFNLASVASMLTPVVSLLLAWYLMNGGRWFYERATRDSI